MTYAMAPAMSLQQLNTLSFARPPALVPLPPRRRHRMRCKSTAIRAALSTQENAAAAAAVPPKKSSIFGSEIPLTGSERVLEGFSGPVRAGACIAIVAAALASGYAGGTFVKGSRVAAAGGAAAVGIAGAAAAYALNSTASRVAALQLHNTAAALPEASALTKQDVDSIVHKYGINKRDQAFTEELRFLYDRYVSSILPPPDKDLQGDEADAIIQFKNALGIDDPDAAAVHMEIGRRIFRKRLEAGDRNAATKELRAFQKLVYVSNLVFGDASTFLLPWKRVFKVTESQVEVAIRENARRLFISKLYEIGGEVDERKIIDLREAQLKLKLPDEVAEECFKAHTRKHIEKNISAAIGILNYRGRLRGSTTKVKEELDKILSYNYELINLCISIDHEKLPRGLESVSVAGGEYAMNERKEDMKQLFRAYLTKVVSSGRLEDEKLEALNNLRDIFCLAPQETDQITTEITRSLYRKRIVQAVKGGDLDIATSKASFLQNLCNELHFDPQKASEIHQEMYKQKLQVCLADGELSKEDVSALLRLRVMLCVPQDTIDAIHLDMCGSLFVKVIDEVLARGVDGYDFKMEEKLHRIIKGLRLHIDTVMGITEREVRAVLLGYARRALGVGNVNASAKELKNMVVFHTFVLSRLLKAIRGEPITAAPELLTEKSKENVNVEQPFLQENHEKSAPRQWLMTLTDSLSLKERMDLYRNYLLFCVSAEAISKESVSKGQSKEYLTLAQLGQILALTPNDVDEVNKSLVEEAFKHKAEEVLGDDDLSKKKLEKVLEIQKQMRLPAERAQRVIRSIIWTRLAGSLMQSVEEGKFTVSDIKEFKELDIDLDNVIPPNVRHALFRNMLSRIFSSGTGEFNEEEVYERIPADLAIGNAEAKMIVEEFARSKLSSSLVHLVSLLRQRKTYALVCSLNNLLACNKVVDSKPLSWSVKEELVEMFYVYLESNPEEEKVARLQYLLNLDDDIASSLKESLENGGSRTSDEFVI